MLITICTLVHHPVLRRSDRLAQLLQHCHPGECRATTSGARERGGLPMDAHQNPHLCERASRRCYTTSNCFNHRHRTWAALQLRSLLGMRSMLLHDQIGLEIRKYSYKSFRQLFKGIAWQKQKRFYYSPERKTV